MPDNLSAEQRSYAMSRVMNRDTIPELTLRRLLHADGLRYRVDSHAIRGRPDIVFRPAGVLVFVDGDFWHGRKFYRWADKLNPYWYAKIARNVERDRQTRRALRRQGWRVVRLWASQVLREPEACAALVRKTVRGRALTRKR